MGVVDSFYKRVESGKEGRNIGIPSGFPKLDKYIYGIQRKYLYTVIGDTGSGKSSLAYFTFIYQPLKYALAHPDIPVNILVLSFEISSEVLLAKLLSLYILDTYHISIGYSEIFSMNEAISDDKLRYIYDAKDWLHKVDNMLTIYDQPLSATGVYNIIRYWAGSFGRFEKVGEAKEVYKKNDPNQYSIVVGDHVGLLNASASGIKYEIDQTAKHFIFYRNLCDLTICAVQQANREFKSMDRRNSAHTYLELQDAKDTSDMTHASEIVIGVYFPYREKRAKCEGFDINKMKDGHRLVQVIKNRYGQSDIMVGSVFHGEIGYFKEIEPPTEGTRYDYNRVMSLEYLYLDKPICENIDTNEDEEKEEEINFNFN